MGSDGREGGSGPGTGMGEESRSNSVIVKSHLINFNVLASYRWDRTKTSMRLETVSPEEPFRTYLNLF